MLKKWFSCAAILSVALFFVACVNSSYEEEGVDFKSPPSSTSGAGAATLRVPEGMPAVSPRGGLWDEDRFSLAFDAVDRAFTALRRCSRANAEFFANLVQQAGGADPRETELDLAELEKSIVYWQTLFVTNLEDLQESYRDRFFELRPPQEAAADCDETLARIGDFFRDRGELPCQREVCVAEFETLRTGVARLLCEFRKDRLSRPDEHCAP